MTSLSKSRQDLLVRLESTVPQTLVLEVRAKYAQHRIHYIGKHAEPLPEKHTADEMETRIEKYHGNAYLRFVQGT